MMDSLLLLMWLADISDGLACLAFMLGALAGMGGFYFYLFGLEDGVNKKHIKTAHKLTALAVVLGLMCAIIPSKNTIYAMAAVHGIKQAAETQIVSKSLKLLEQKIDKALKEGEQND